MSRFQPETSWAEALQYYRSPPLQPARNPKSNTTTPNILATAKAIRHDPDVVPMPRSRLDNAVDMFKRAAEKVPLAGNVDMIEASRQRSREHRADPSRRRVARTEADHISVLDCEAGPILHEARHAVLPLDVGRLLAHREVSIDGGRIDETICKDTGGGSASRQRRGLYDMQDFKGGHPGRERAASSVYADLSQNAQKRWKLVRKKHGQGAWLLSCDGAELKLVGSLAHAMVQIMAYLIPNGEDDDAVEGDYKAAVRALEAVRSAKPRQKRRLQMAKDRLELAKSRLSEKGSTKMTVLEGMPRARFIALTNARHAILFYLAGPDRVEMSGLVALNDVESGLESDEDSTWHRLSYPLFRLATLSEAVLQEDEPAEDAGHDERVVPESDIVIDEIQEIEDQQEDKGAWIDVKGGNVNQKPVASRTRSKVAKVFQSREAKRRSGKE